jgi:hypothetical protein
MLKWILKEYCVRLLSEFSWPRKGTLVDSVFTYDEGEVTSASIRISLDSFVVDKRILRPWNIIVIIRRYHVSVAFPLMPIV